MTKKMTKKELFEKLKDVNDDAIIYFEVENDTYIARDVLTFTSRDGSQEEVILYTY
jgi:hypothetical protein